MSKRTRQYLGLISSILAYYVIHEGAHLVYALMIGTFRQINFLGLGVQIDIYADHMTNLQLGIFCIVGSVATAIAAYIFTSLANRICNHPSSLFKACMYYITIALLFLDPIYLSILSDLFGGGDMNGICLLIPKPAARMGYGALLSVNTLVFAKILLPKYRLAFSQSPSPHQ
jgi:hypothetical protein